MSEARRPHAYPFLLLDRVVEVRPGAEAVAIRCLTRDDPLLDADGCLPSVLLAEVLAQCAGLAVYSESFDAPPVVARFNRFRSRRLACAGVELRVNARVVKTFGGTAMVRGVVRADGRRCAAGEVVLRIGTTLGGRTAP